jgi:hypothetical protein
MKISKTGNVYADGDRVNNNFFRTPCFNAGYEEYLLNEIKEILTLGPDGIFCDCLLVDPCYCPSCIKLMRGQGIDLADDEAVLRFSYDTSMRVIKKIRDIVPQDIRLYLNSFPYELIADLQSHAETECLPSGGWGYDYFGVQAPYFKNFSSDRLYMTGSFVNGWGDLGGKVSKAALENDAYDALLHAYGISVGDHIHPHGTLSKKLYENIGEIFSFVKSLEPWTENADTLSDVCVLRNKAPWHKREQKPTDSERGVCRMLSELKICYDVMNEDMDFSAYRLLILPDEIAITPKIRRKLEQYDGYIISTGKSIISGSVWDFIKLCGDDTHTDSFYSIGDGEVYAAYTPSVLMKSDYSVAEYIEPYFDKVWDGLHGYFYIPPKGSTEYSTVAKKGKVAHVCFDVFGSYFNNGAIFHKKLMESMINSFLSDRLILTDDLPSTSRAAILSNRKDDMLMVKTTYPELRGKRCIIEEHTCLPAGIRVSVAGEYASVCTLPEKEPVKSVAKNGRTEITLPEICGFKAFLLNQ